MDHLSSWYYAAHWPPPELSPPLDTSYAQYFEWLKQYHQASSPHFGLAPQYPPNWSAAFPQTPLTPSSSLTGVSSPLSAPTAFSFLNSPPLQLTKEPRLEPVSRSCSTPDIEVAPTKQDSKLIQCHLTPKSRNKGVQTLCCAPETGCDSLHNLVKLRLSRKLSTKTEHLHQHQEHNPWRSHRTPAQTQLNVSPDLFGDSDVSDSELSAQTAAGQRTAPLQLRKSPLDAVVTSRKPSSTPCRKQVGVVKARLRGHSSPNQELSRVRRKLDVSLHSSPPKASRELDLLCLAADICQQNEKPEASDTAPSTDQWPDVNSVSNLRLSYDLAREKGLDLDPDKRHFAEAQDSSVLVQNLEAVWRLLQERRRQLSLVPSSSSSRKRRRPVSTPSSTSAKQAFSSPMTMLAYCAAQRADDPKSIKIKKESISEDETGMKQSRCASLTTIEQEPSEKVRRLSKKSVSRPPTPEMRSCQLSAVDLRDEQRLLVSLEGLWYAGVLKEVEPPDVYRVSLDGCLRNRHQYLTREELLSGAVLELRPETKTELPVGTRVCAYWSSSLTALYPGTVQTPPDSLPSDEVFVSFDDEDQKPVKIAWVRMLPPDSPVVSHVSRQPQAEFKPRAARLKSQHSSPGLHSPGSNIITPDRKRITSSNNTAPEPPVVFEWGDVGKKKGKKDFHNVLLRDGVRISVGDAVMFKSLAEKSFFGRVISLWDDEERRMWVEAAWFYQPCEMGAVGKSFQSLQGRVLFCSRHQDKNEARTILRKVDIVDAYRPDLPPHSYFLAGDYDASLGKVVKLDSTLQQD